MSNNFGAPDPGQLASLLFELANQLHQERAQRIALETALIDQGILNDGAIIAAAEPARARTAAALDAAMAGIMRSMLESSEMERSKSPSGERL